MRITVIGIGPGTSDEITLRALIAMRQADVIIGYTLYVELVRPLFPDKEFISTGMRAEEARCRIAVERAAAGQHVCVVCSGDAGVYGLAGLILTMAAGTGVEVEIVPGLTAAVTGAALLGAPLTHDFAVISLSDALTPWDTIATRLRCAAEADFVIVLYNPMSRRRTEYLRMACDIVLAYRSEQTPVGIAKSIGREGQAAELTTLGALRNSTVDMFTTVFIGNSQTRTVEGRMVTPRGYAAEKEKHA